LAQLAALEQQAAGLVAARTGHEAQGLRLAGVAKDVQAATSVLESQVAASLLSQERVDAAVAAMLQQTARLEAKVKVLEEEKARVGRKIANYEEASQAFCFNFSAAFNVSNEGMMGTTNTPAKKAPATEVRAS
jgi:hypothetical protein